MITIISPFINALYNLQIDNLLKFRSAKENSIETNIIKYSQKRNAECIINYLDAIS